MNERLTLVIQVAQRLASTALDADTSMMERRVAAHIVAGDWPADLRGRGGATFPGLDLAQELLRVGRDELSGSDLQAARRILVEVVELAERHTHERKAAPEVNPVVG